MFLNIHILIPTLTTQGRSCQAMKFLRRETRSAWHAISNQMQPPLDLSLILTTLLAANIPVKRTSSTHQNEEFTMNKHATRHRGRHYYNRTAIYWHLIVVVFPMATHAGLFTTARAPCIYPRIHCMLTCCLEAALSYTLPVDTIFTIARYRIYHFLQSRAAGFST